MSSDCGVLMLGFGGPTPGCCGRRAVCSQAPGCEAECFVSGILGDSPARAGRVAQVVAHYAHLGGFSPYNALTLRQAEHLARALAARGAPMPVACGFRHWRPWADQGLTELGAAGCRRAIALIMAPHQSTVSWDWYLKYAAEAKERVGEAAPALVGVVQPWWNDAGYVDAIVRQLRALTAGWTAQRIADAALIFTAHAIPQPVEATSPYRRQFADTARAAAEAFGHGAHVIAFQSQPDDSRVPWSAPTIQAALDQAHAAGRRDAIVQPAGFLVDHVEVLHDLDIEAKAHADAIGISFHRAACVHDDPGFIGMLADRILAAAAQAAGAALAGA